MVNAIYNFTDFDTQVRQAALKSGEVCAQKLHLIHKLLTDKYENDKAAFKTIKTSFGA